MKRKITSFFYWASAIFLGFSLFFIIFYETDNFQAKASVKAVPEREAGEILVKFKGSKDINVIKIAQDRDFTEILKSYNQNPEVEYAEPNYKYGAAMIPSDTYFSNQWYLDKIQAVKAWDTIRESPNIVIAILDSGVEVDHPDLKDNIWVNPKEIQGDGIDNDNNGYVDDINGWDFVNNVPDPSPKFKPGFTEDGVLHGTVVAGIAAASGNNAAGIAGVTWRTQIMPLKVLDDKGEGNTVNVIKGIDYAINNGANIINFSFVGFGYSKSMDDAIRRAYNAGIIIVAAAGNEQSDGTVYSLDDTPMYPVCYDGLPGENMVLGVAATDTLDQKAAFSSFGLSCVDLAAPGIGIFSTVVYSPTNHLGNKSFNKYYDGFWAGTSMATPMVAGAAALVETANPSLSRNQVMNVLMDNADNINRLNPNYLNKLGKGRLNIAAAINAVEAALNNQVTRLIIAPFSKSKGLVKITDENGAVKGREFLPYGDTFRGGVNTASGHLSGENSVDIVTAPISGTGPLIKIFDLNEKLEKQFYAYGKSFQGGVSLAVGDVNNDGLDEIVTGAGPGGGPHIKIFNLQGELLGQFFAFNPSFRGGVSVAVGDIDGDGKKEIITGAGPGGGPQVKIFTASGQLVSQFFAYDSRFRGGVRVAVGEVSGGASGNKAEIITAPGPGGGPQIRIFTNKAVAIGQFFAYGNTFRGGVSVVTGDIDNDGTEEIITGAGPGGSPHVRAFKSSGQLLGSFYAYESSFPGGVTAGVLRGNKDAIDAMATSSPVQLK